MANASRLQPTSLCRFTRLPAIDLSDPSRNIGGAAPGGIASSPHRLLADITRPVGARLSSSVDLGSLIGADVFVRGDDVGLCRLWGRLIWRQKGTDDLLTTFLSHLPLSSAKAGGTDRLYASATIVLVVLTDIKVGGHPLELTLEARSTGGSGQEQS